jgi:ABC-type uncharacterized transport system substrate-binding protein
MGNVNKIFAIFFLLIFFLGVSFLNCKPKTKRDNKEISKILAFKKIVYINSYHNNYKWSDGIEKGFLNFLNIQRFDDGTFKSDHKNLFLKIFRMDSKRNQSEKYLKKISQKIYKEILEINPDIIIASDDNASKYIIYPYFSHSKTPVIFCGVNWDVSFYGYPKKNITGMIEIQLIKELVFQLSKYSKGKRIAYLKGRDLTAVKETFYFEKQLGKKLIKRFVKDKEEWKQEFIKLQDEVDIILIGNMIKIKNWDFKDKEIENFILKNTKIPTGAWDTWVSPYALLTVATMPEEQGEWAAKTSIKVLSGTPIEDIPIVTNIKSKKIINFGIAKKLKINLKNIVTNEYEIINNKDE